jgi:hypothetical protein
MRAGYYPWKLDNLVVWLNEERPNYESSKLFSLALGIPMATLRTWTVRRLPSISLADLRSLADYRQCSISQLSEWLEITPEHLELLAQVETEQTAPSLK